MHELAIAQSLLEQAVSTAQGSRIVALFVKVGEASGIQAESLRFCLQAVAKGTIAEGARMELVACPGGAVFLESLDLE